MGWTYVQGTGDLLLNGAHVARGYSGSETGKNDPALESVRGIGPIPEGEWAIVGPPRDSHEHGPFVLELLPLPGTDTFGRFGFLIHGDSILHPGGGSTGCIVMNREVRETIWASGDRSLTVIGEGVTPLPREPITVS